MTETTDDAGAQRLIILTGAMAAGKSTVAQGVAERLTKSVHLRGDVFRRMIVRGAAAMGPQLSAEALGQLLLRHAIACDAARAYFEAGFSVVYQDIIVGADLARVRDRLADLRPKVIALVPDAATLLLRDTNRAKTGYAKDFPPEILAAAFANELPDDVVRVDTSRMTTADVIDLVLSL